MKNLSVQTLLDQLETKQYLPHRQQAEAFILCEENQDHLPIYVHVLLGFGALMGCLCAIGLLNATELVRWDDYRLLIILGIISIALAIIINYALENSTELLHSFSLQLTCILILFGKLIFVWGLTNELHQALPTIHVAWLSTASIALITIPTYFLYPIMLDRFISSLVLLSAIFVSILLTQANNQLLYLYYLVLLMSAGYLVNSSRKLHQFEVLSYACLAALGVCAIYLSTHIGAMNYLWLEAKGWSVPIIAFNITLALAMILQTFTIKVTPPRNQLIYASGCIGLLVLGLISTNGILYGMGLMLIGYEKHRRILIIWGAIFLALFIIDYYYSLSLSLAHKAAILAGSGAVLLLARMVLQHEHWDKHHD